MKNRVSVKHVLLSFSLLMICVVALIMANTIVRQSRVAAQSDQRGARPQGDAPQRPRIVDGTRSLRDEARAAGGNFVGYGHAFRTPRFNDIGEVARHSTAIIIGTAGTNRCRLSADEREVTIDYEVTVQQVLKGNLQPNSTVTVSLPGGRVHFTDGSTAEVRTPWFRKMQQGGTYILFLTPRGNETYMTTGGPQGVFGLAAGVSGTVESHSGRLRDPVWQYHNRPAQDFLALVSEAVRRRN